MTTKRIIEEIKCRIKYIDDVIDDYNELISHNRAIKNYFLVDKYTEIRNEACNERDLLKSMLFSSNIKL